MATQPRLSRSVLIFTFIGPVIGHLLLVPCIWFIAAFAEAPGGDGRQLELWIFLFSLLVGGLPFAFIYGLVPAFVTGLCYGVLLDASCQLRRSKQWVRGSAAATIGLLATSCTVIVLNKASTADRSSLFVVAAGAVTAFLIGYAWPSAPVPADNALPSTCENARA